MRSHDPRVQLVKRLAHHGELTEFLKLSPPLIRPCASASRDQLIPFPLCALHKENTLK